MLRRCYDEKFKTENKTYSDCFVCDEWLLFSNFKLWMQGQNWKGRQLDKDIISKGNKEYSPEKCVFVTSEINTLFRDGIKRSSDLPVGVTLTDSGKFKSSMKKSGKSFYIGVFATENCARLAYIKEKKSHVVKIAMGEDEPLRSILLSCDVR